LNFVKFSQTISSFPWYWGYSKKKSYTHLCLVMFRGMTKHKKMMILEL